MTVHNNQRSEKSNQRRQNKEKNVCNEQTETEYTFTLHSVNCAEDHADKRSHRDAFHQKQQLLLATPLDQHISEAADRTNRVSVRNKSMNPLYRQQKGNRCPNSISARVSDAL